MEDKFYMEILVIYKDDMENSKSKRFLPYRKDATHFYFINQAKNIIEIILRKNIIRMEETKKTKLNDYATEKIKDSNWGW